jgi:cyclic beta-1,2-glucan synthetase
VNGLPLIGSGDWNDGLNLVGMQGRGESAWLGWFLCDVYTRFARISTERGEAARAADLLKRRAALLEALESKAWDGGWYLRGFYDDPDP